MKYFDFHCHLDTKELMGSREQLLHDMKEQDFGACTIGVNLERSKIAVAMATACENVWCCVGQHPSDKYAEEFKSSEYQKLIDEHPSQIVGIGETGLDYYWPTKDVEAGKKTNDDLDEEKKRQRLLFQKQITLAIANDLPLMLHVRSSEGTTDAHDEVLNILSGYEDVRAVFHFYTEGAELAKQIIDAGYYISFPGVITFGKKVEHLEQAVREMPPDRMFAETDTPYAAPVPHRGQVNNPMYVGHVYKKIAELRGEEEEVVRKQILQNVENFYNITF